PTRPTSQEGCVANLIADLEQVARYRNLLALRNSDLSDPLGNALDLTLLRNIGNNSWEEAKPDASGRVVYNTGDRIAFRIRKRVDEPLYVYILDFSMMNNIGIIHPEPGADDKPFTGATVQRGVEEGDELELFVPDKFTGEEGLETLKLIAS